MQLFHVAVVVEARSARFVVPCADKESDMTGRIEMELDPRLEELAPEFVEDGLPGNPADPLVFDPRAFVQWTQESNSGDTSGK
jgi:hypothetical protein